MDSKATRTLERIVARAKNDPHILAVMPFGSQARGEAHAASDIDVCLVMVPDFDRDEAFATKLSYSGSFDVDVAIFQELPLHIRTRVLKDGTVVFVRDEDALYDVAIRTVRAWEDFRHIHRAYLDQVARG
jgi:predicted nucleotidyltransferase